MLCKPCHKDEHGFTLLEVLVVMVLFSLLITTAVMGFSQFLGIFNTRLTNESDTFREFRKITLIERSLCSLFDYTYKDTNGYWYPYFEGTAKELSYISKFSVFSQSKTVLARLSLEKGGGTYNLVYSEKSIDGKLFGLHNLLEDVPEQTTILFSNLSKGTFSYYGPNNLDYQNFAWRNKYLGWQRDSLPLKIELQFSRQGETRRFLFHTAGGIRGKLMHFNGERAFES